MSVCVYSVCVVLCVGSSSAMGISPIQRGLLTVYMITKLKKQPGTQQRAIEPLMDEWMTD
jgi:hypothetical protein